MTDSARICIISAQGAKAIVSKSFYVDPHIKRPKRNATSRNYCKRRQLCLYMSRDDSVNAGRGERGPFTLRFEFRQLFHQTALAARGIAFVGNATARQFIQISDGHSGCFTRFFQVAAFNGCARLLDQRTSPIAVGTIVQATFFVLSDTLQCGFMSCHKLVRGTSVPAAPSKASCSPECLVLNKRASYHNAVSLSIARSQR